jgi:superoxide reductase
MIDIKFYKCNHCGNIVEVINDGGVIPVCCGDPMELLKPNSTEAAREKHIPIIEKNGDTVTVRVGSEPHPMIPEHYIMWIILAQGDQVQLAKLQPGGEPNATFKIADENAPVTAYEYCNLHGLWAAEA